MKKTVSLTIAAAGMCLLTGCETTGLSAREHSGVDYPNYVLSLPADRPANSPKPALPIHLAVAQIGESAPPKTMLDALAARSDLITSVVALPLPCEAVEPYRYRSKEVVTDYAGRVKAICRLAKASGADYVFLFGGNVDSWTDGNALRFFDITIIGGMILPGTKVNLEGKGAGTLIEAATEQPVIFINADNNHSQYSPDFFSDDKTMDMRVQARDELVKKLQAGLLEKLAAWR